MSIGEVLVLPGVGGSGSVDVRPSHTKDKVIVTRKDKIVVYNIEEKEVEHTWYVGSEGSKIQSAIASPHDEKLIVVAAGKSVIFAGFDTNKLDGCKKVDVGAETHNLLVHQGELLVVFSHGGIENLQVFLDDEDEHVTVTPLLSENEQVLQTRLMQDSAVTRLGLLVKDDSSTGELSLVTGQVVLEGQGKAIVNVQRTKIGSNLDCCGIELSSNLSVYALNKDSSCLQKWREDSWEKILEIPGLEHSDLVGLGENHVAVMGSLQEGGYLHIICTKYLAVVAKTKLKNTQHQGKGIYWVGERVYLSNSSKLLCAAITGLSGGLAALLGTQMSTSMISPYNKIPTLIEQSATEALMTYIKTLQDLPEPLIIDCLIYFLNQKSPRSELIHMRHFFAREFSEVLLEQELPRLSLEHVVELLGILEALLQAVHDDDDEIECNESQIIAWLGVLLNSHYLQLVVAKDSDTKAVVNKIQETVSEVQQSTRTLLDCRTLTHNIMNTDLPPAKNNNQSYCIQIIQI